MVKKQTPIALAHVYCILIMSKGSRNRKEISQSRPLHTYVSDFKEHGWRKTGECLKSFVEFWERDGVKIDYFPTTGEKPKKHAQACS